MTITIHAQGAERKRLVQTISVWLGVPAKYCGAPTFNYEVDYFTIYNNDPAPLEACLEGSFFCADKVFAVDCQNFEIS